MKAILEACFPQMKYIQHVSLIPEEDFILDDALIQDDCTVIWKSR